MRILDVKSNDGKFVYVLKSITKRFVEHNVSRVAGQLSYFMLLSIFPFLIFINALIGSFDISITRLTDFLQPIFPPQIVALISGYIEQTALSQSIGLLSIGIVVVIFSASKSVRSLDFAINTAYGTTESKNVFKDFFYSMLFVIAAGITIVIVALFVTLSSDFLTEIIKVNHLSEFAVSVLGVCRWVMLVAILFFILAVVYKITPNKKVSAMSIFPGTTLATLGLILLTYGFSTYVDHFMRGSIFNGTIGVVVMLMLWIYFASVIIVLGAELNSTLEDYKRERSSEGEAIK